MKIGILGGQFNPPHLGHLLMAKEALNFAGFDEVWLTPCYKHTFAKTMAEAKHREAMTKLVCQGKIKYCGLEIKNKLSGNTLELMDLLKCKYPVFTFTFIIGSDNLPDFKKWGEWKKLITTYDFLLIPRAGYDCNLKKYGLNKKEYKFKILKHKNLALSNISATMIRERLKNNISIDNLIDKKVYKYIRKHRLYSFK